MLIAREKAKSGHFKLIKRRHETSISKCTHGLVRRPTGTTTSQGRAKGRSDHLRTVVAGIY
jgi:hypothetical protein